MLVDVNVVVQTSVVDECTALRTGSESILSTLPFRSEQEI